jgi:hypothetical protein
VNAALVDGALERRQRDSLGVCRTIGLRGERGAALADKIGELLRTDRFIHEPPLLGARALHAVGTRAEDVGVIAPHPALVGQSRQTASARKDAQQRHFREADR